jgi:hypothetical protein
VKTPGRRGEDSFDAKQCHSEEFIFQKLAYIHHNPVSKKWNLVTDFTEYEHSSASFYESATKKYDHIVHVRELLASEVPGSPFAQTPAQ